MPRKLLIGIDEAGYGPNIGPLVIGASVWDVPSELDSETLGNLLFPEFQVPNGSNHDVSVPFGDSKQLYKSQGSVRPLAIGVHALAELASQKDAIGQFRDCHVAGPNGSAWNKLPWYQPSILENGELFPKFDVGETCAIEKARRKLDSLDIRLISLTSRIIDEQTFNVGVEKNGNKASLLSSESINLAKKCLVRAIESPACPFGNIAFECDKHGGRNRYQAILFQAFPDDWFHALQESTLASHYKSQFSGIPVNWAFRAKGDRSAAPAAASMIAKWTREVLLDRLNRFWREKCPGISPTAGYPTDAKRFATEIQSVAAELGMTREHWWRNC